MDHRSRRNLWQHLTNLELQHVIKQSLSFLVIGTSMKRYLDRAIQSGMELSFVIPQSLSLGLTVLEQATQSDFSQLETVAATLQQSSFVNELANTHSAAMDILTPLANAASAVDSVIADTASVVDSAVSILAG